MQVARWGNSLAVRLPKALVDGLGLKPGDQVELVQAGEGRFELMKRDGETAFLERLRALQRPAPQEFRWSREEANER